MARRKKGAPVYTEVGRPLLSGSQLEADPELIKKVTTILRIGSYIECAAAINGVGYTTLREWISKSKLYPDSLYGEFAAAVQKAIAEAETRDLALIDTHAQGREAIYEYEVVMEPFLDAAGHAVMDRYGKPALRPMRDSKGDPVKQIARNTKGEPIVKRSEIKSTWTAAAWKLERRNPSRWGRSDRLEVDTVLKQETPEEAPKDIVVTEYKIKATLEKIRNEY
jgi:hypothetical protein